MLTEDQLEEMVFDLGVARKGQLNENILHVFAAWIEYLLSKMYKGRRIPVKVRGNRIEVQRFTDALVNEKRYMDYIKKLFRYQGISKKKFKGLTGRAFGA